jgi:uncharacterized protein (TIGR02246 family)
MRLSIRLVIATLALAMGPLSARATEPVPEGIQETIAAFTEALTGGTGEDVAQCYTEDATVIAPGAEIAEGREAIAALWQGMIDGKIHEAELTTVKLDISGNLASEQGTARLVLGEEATEVVVRYLVTWREQDGRWLMLRDIWN